MLLASIAVSLWCHVWPRSLQQEVFSILSNLCRKLALYLWDHSHKNSEKNLCMLYTSIGLFCNQKKCDFHLQASIPLNIIYKSYLQMAELSFVIPGNGTAERVILTILALHGKWDQSRHWSCSPAQPHPLDIYTELQHSRGIKMRKSPTVIDHSPY